MDKHDKTGFRLGIDGWFLLVCVVVFICGLVTPVFNSLVRTGSSIIWLVDVRNWTQLGWFIANLVLVLVLVSIAYGSRMQAAWVEHRIVAAKKRDVAAKERDEREGKKKRQERKKRVQEIREWRRKH